MANATTKIVEVKTVNLELTVEEALFIRTVMRSVYGCPYNSARRLADQISDEILKVTPEFAFVDLEYSFKLDKMNSQGIGFKDGYVSKF